MIQIDFRMTDVIDRFYTKHLKQKYPDFVVTKPISDLLTLWVDWQNEIWLNIGSGHCGVVVQSDYLCQLASAKVKLVLGTFNAYKWMFAELDLHNYSFKITLLSSRLVGVFDSFKTEELCNSLDV